MCDKLIHIPEGFVRKFPNLSPAKQRKHYIKYITVIRDYMFKRLPFLNEDYTYLPKKKMFDECGEFQYKNTRYYIWKEFSEVQPFFYYTESDTGNNLKFTKNLFERNTKVRFMDFHHRHIDILIDLGSAEELVKLFYGDLSEENIDKLHVIDIDMTSLNNFIDNCNVSLKTLDSADKRLQKIRTNRYQAKYTKIIGEFFEQVYGRPVLPMLPKKSQYGRTYYKGINLMSMSEEVRRAVIGSYHQYDLNAAVYAIKLMLAKDILKEQGISHIGKFTFTKEYLDRKSRLRKDLVKECMKDTPVNFDSKLKYIKEAITAIGFGARIGGSGWQTEDNTWKNPAINDIIKNPKDRERFINHSFVIGFTKEQKDMTKLIVDYYLQDTEFVNTIQSIKDMYNNNGRVRKAQVMAYIYQKTEALIMDQIEPLANDVVIRIHDALITKKTITNNNLLDIKQILNELDTELTIDHEFKGIWTEIGEEDDDPRDAYVRQMYKTKNNNIYGITGNYQSYKSTTQYEQLEEEEFYYV